MRITKSCFFFCAVLLVLLLQTLCFPAMAASPAEPQSGTCDNLNWYYSSGTLTITGNGPMNNDWCDDSVWPWAHLSEDVQTIHIDEGVTTVGMLAFADFTALDTVILPDSLTEISDYGFFRCNYLDTIYCNGMKNTLPDNLEYIGISAFCRCYFLESITFGPNVSYIANCAFSFCYSLESVTLPSSLTEVNSLVFYACSSLRAVEFPASISYIDENAFGYCYKLKSIKFDGNAPEIHKTAFNACTGIFAYYPAGNRTWTADKLKTDGNIQTWKAVSSPSLPSDSCGEGLGWYVEDETLVIYGSGPMRDFLYSNAPWYKYSDEISAVYIEEGVTTIGDYAFDGFSNLITVGLPDTLTSIGDYAFKDCLYLSWLFDSNLIPRLPDSVEYIGEGAFDTCMSLREMVMGNNVSYIGNYAFRCCVSLRQISLSAKLSFIGDGTFTECRDLQSIYIPASVSYIGYEAFLQCDSLKTIIFVGNAPLIEENAFYSYFDPLKITAYYPANDASWTQEVRGNYSAEITWKINPAGSISTGSCGENAEWTLMQDGTLIISGTGEMYDYDTIDYPPWYGYKEYITAVVMRPHLLRTVFLRTSMQLPIILSITPPGRRISSFIAIAT